MKKLKINKHVSEEKQGIKKGKNGQVYLNHVQEKHLNAINEDETSFRDSVYGLKSAPPINEE